MTAWRWVFEKHESFISFHAKWSCFAAVLFSMFANEVTILDVVSRYIIIIFIGELWFWILGFFVLLFITIKRRRARRETKGNEDV